MAGGDKLYTDLLLRVGSDTAQLKAGLQKAQSDINGFQQGVNKAMASIKAAMISAFAATAVITAAKEIFEFGKQIDDLAGSIDDLGYGMNLAFNTAKVKALSDAFEIETDKIVKAANAVSASFGISFTDSLKYIQQGLALAGTDSNKFLDTLEKQGSTFKAAGGSADQFFSTVTNGMRNGTKVEEELKKGAEATKISFDELTKQMNDGQLLQMQLVDSSTELNKIWVKTFDGSNDGVTKLKILFNELTTKSIKGLVKGVIEVSNFFIDLYNNSMIFRGVIEAIALNFKMLWEGAKLLWATFINGIATAGKLIKAVFTADFAAIPGILKEAFTESVNSVKTFGTNTANNFVTAFNNTVKGNPISLIGESAEDEGKDTARLFNSGLEKIKIGENLKVDTAPLTDGFQTSMNDLLAKTKTSFANINANMTVSPSTMTAYEAQLIRMGEFMEQYGNEVSTMVGAVSGVFNQLVNDIISGNAAASDSFRNLGMAIVQAVLQILVAKMAEAMITAIANAFSSAPHPLVGLAIGAIAVAGIAALVASSIPEFATGGISSGGAFIAGDGRAGRGGELVVPDQRGHRIYNHSQTMAMMKGNNQQEITLRLYGEDLVGSTTETLRRRNNSR